MYAEKIPGRCITIDQKQYLYFGGTSYLGMHARPDFGALVTEGIQLFGTNYGASRHGAAITVFYEAETKMQTWLEAPACVWVSSGTLAGRLALAVLGDDYQYHYMPNTHVAIHPFFDHHTPGSLNGAVEDTLDLISNSAFDQHVIAMNTFDSLTASALPLDWIQRIPKNKKVILLIDDSHGIGVVGNRGQGMYSMISSLHEDTIMISSLGKGMGLPAGVIAGPVEFIAACKAHGMFGGSSPSIPAYSYAYLHADTLYQNARQIVTHHMTTFNQSLRTDLFSYTSGFPIYYTKQDSIADYLMMQGIKIPSFSYPRPVDKKYTRIILHGLHTAEDIHTLAQLLANY